MAAGWYHFGPSPGLGPPRTGYGARRSRLRRRPGGADSSRRSREKGDALRGAAVFAEAKLACLSCHKVGQQGGVIGPDLSAVGRCLTPEQIVESVFWPARLVKPEYNAVVVATTDGRTIQGYREAVSDKEMTLRVAATGEKVQIAKADIEGVREQGTLMPAALAASLDDAQRRDLIRFLMELGRAHGPGCGYPDPAGPEPCGGHISRTTASRSGRSSGPTGVMR